MKPTRTCNWPPRLDVVLGPGRRRPRMAPYDRRAWRPVDERLREVARARWAGRPAKQRRFEPVYARGPAL